MGYRHSFGGDVQQPDRYPPVVLVRRASSFETAQESGQTWVCLVAVHRGVALETRLGPRECIGVVEPRTLGVSTAKS
jgi:hypothetical protein